MSLTDENGIAKMLKSGLTENIWLMFGDDGFLKDFYCKKLVKTCVSEELRFFNFHVFNDAEKSLDDIFETAGTLPVMSDKICLLIKNYPLCDLGDSQLEDFKAKLKSVPETTVMIFFYSTVEIFDGKKPVSKWGKTYTVLSSVGTAVNLSHREQNKIAKMLVSRAKTRGTSIDEATAEYLINTVGDDMQTLLNEFNKVCSYSDGQPVTTEMIDMTAVKSIDANVFEISTSILSGNTDKAFEVANELIRTKVPVQKIIGPMATAFINLYRLKTAKNEGYSVNDFASAFAYTNFSYTFGKLSPYASKISANALKDTISVLLETDVKSKSTAFEPAVLMSELIGRLAQICSER